MTMRVKFYGVRGSIATAGEETRRYGGNTSCVAVFCDDETLVFDAGTGIRKLGADLLRAGRPVDAHLFFSHLHWDHIQGFPFFTPAFIPGQRVQLYGVTGEPGEAHAAPVREAMARQMTAPNFPVSLDTMRADLRFVDVPYGERILVPSRLGRRIEVRHTAVDHPNGCVAYRVDYDGRSVVYATDLELMRTLEGDAAHDESLLSLVDLAAGADLLVFDAMYTPEEYEGSRGPARRGWGHSTFDVGAQVAEQAGVKTLALFHHDPAHDDAFMDGLAARAQQRLSSTIVAQEGMELSL